jgi:hypothetical protein
MYKHLNIVPGLISAAKEIVVTNDRMLYAPFFTIIEKYCERVCVIGGRVGADLLIGQPLHKDSFMWEIYTNNTYETAMHIADDFMNAHSPHIDPKTTVLNTNERNIEQTISINGRAILKIYRLDQYRNVDLMEMVRPVISNGYFGGKVQCLSEEIQLSDIYQTLYSPGKFDKWESALSNEEKMYNFVEPYLEKVYLGGNNDSIFGSMMERDVIIIKSLTADGGIIIGSIAMRLLGLSSSIQRLQVIIDKPIEDIVKKLTVVLNDTLGGQNPIQLSHVEYKLHLVSDFRLTKHTIYIVKSSTERTAIVDIFNSTAYELIPISHIDTKLDDDNFKNVLVGNHYVLLRFKMVDAWAVKLILGISKSEAAVRGAKASMVHIIEDIRLLRAEIKRLIGTPDGLKILFPNGVDQKYDYIGNYVTEKISKKKLLQGTREYFAPYYPAKKMLVSPSEAQKLNE